MQMSKKTFKPMRLDEDLFDYEDKEIVESDIQDVQDIDICFNDQTEVLKIINTGGDIINYLTKESPICPLMGSKIKLDKVLGKGKSGKVFEVQLSYSDQNFHTYAVKRTRPLVNQYLMENIKSFYKYIKENKIDLGKLLKYNNITEEELESSVIIYIPSFMLGSVCSSKFVCDSDYSEYIISVLVANLKRKMISANFIDTFLFATCEDPDQYRSNHFIFMEKVDATFGNIIDIISEKTYSGKIQQRDSMAVNSIFIQTLHAIAAYQQKYKIVHGDLHQDNVFIEYVTEETTVNGENLYDAEFFKYKIGNTKLYVPATKHIVKIGDWGYACKYSKPLVCNKNVFDGMHLSIPDFYNVSYDTLYISQIFWEHNPSNEFVKNVLLKMYGEKSGVPKRLSQKYLQKSGRPIISKVKNLDKTADPTKILKDSILMQNYLKKPTGKIVLMGDIK
jgi:hypothetical protein